MDWLSNLVDQRIREAMARGEFDDLPGAGRPIDLSDADDPDWWLKRYLRREKIDLSAVLPPVFALRKEAEAFPESLRGLGTEEEVRAVLADYNARVEDAWRGPISGPSLPVTAAQVDVEELVAQWRLSREAEATCSTSPEEENSGPAQAEASGRRRLFGRVRRR